MVPDFPEGGYAPTRIAWVEFVSRPQIPASVPGVFGSLGGELEKDNTF